MQNVAEIKRKAPVDFQPEFPRGRVTSHRHSSSGRVQISLLPALFVPSSSSSSSSSDSYFYPSSIDCIGNSNEISNGSWMNSDGKNTAEWFEKKGRKKNKKQMHRFKWQIDRWNEPGRKFHWKIAGVWVTEKSPERLLIITRMNRSMAQILFDFLFRLIAVNGEFWLAAKFRPASSNQCHLIAFIASFLFRDGSLG